MKYENLVLPFLILSGAGGILLYIYSFLSNGFEVETFWYAWWFSMFMVIGIPFVLAVDWFVGNIYEKKGSEKNKIVYLFVANIVEVFILIIIVMQVDYWLEGVSSSMLSECLIGFGFFFLIEFAFKIFNQRQSKENNKKEVDN